MVAGSGHIEQGETPQEAVIRECREEIGIKVLKTDIHFKHVTYVTLSEGSYVYFYFKVTNICDEPQLIEKNKVEEIEWFNLSDLPENMMPEHRAMLSEASVYLEW